MKLSIVIPTLNEAAHIGETLGRLKPCQAEVELWVVDGGSQDQTCAIAQNAGAQVLETHQGRFAQLNLGAAQSTGDVLIFLHADTHLPPCFDQEIAEVLGQTGVIAGAFPLAIANAKGGLRWVAWGTNQRSRWLQLPYGDRALFMRQETFQSLGGFPDLPIMEDFELVRRLRQRGKIGLATSPVLTSDRRWRKLGVVATTIRNQLMLMGYFAGIPPQRLANWYRRPLGRPRQTSDRYP